MWDARERLDADMQYAIRMVQTRCATIEQAAVMCGLDVDALRAQFARTQTQAQTAGNEQRSYALHRHVPGA